MLSSCFIGPTWLINIKQMQSRHKYKIIEDQIIEFCKVYDISSLWLKL
jgi:hypothetical protein